MKVVVFAGGVGTRLWPLSRKKTPKQFEKIIGDKSTLQLAIERLRPDFDYKDIYVSTGGKYVGIVKKQLPKLPEENIIGEPEMRDVGPAVGLMTAILEKEDPDTPFAILWSDHLVGEKKLFLKVLKAAEKIVKKEKKKIVFLGQKPRFASCNLGWIEYGQKIMEVSDLPVFEFKNLVYRPDTETAKKFLKDKKHAWNPGYFVTTPGFLWEQYRRFTPTLYEPLREIQRYWKEKKFEKVLGEVYPGIKKISFDNAILEQLDGDFGLVISCDLKWSDVGAWEALKEALSKSEEDNITRGRVNLKDTKDSLVYNFTNQVVFTIDLEGILVINTGDVLLVCSKDSVPKIKELVNGLKGTELENLS